MNIMGKRPIIPNYEKSGQMTNKNGQKAPPDVEH